MDTITKYDKIERHRINSIKEDISSSLNTLQVRISEDYGTGIPEFTKLLLEVLEEHSLNYIRDHPNTQIIRFNLDKERD